MSEENCSWRAVSGLTLIYCMRMLGLFLIFPLLTPYVDDWQVSGVMLGLAFGIFALTQSVLQIPFGILSDRIGRKPVLFIGLILFALGSIMCALANNITWFIIGRAVQGMGAIAGVILAFTTDITTEKHRSVVMAIIGMAIGVMFFVAMILGPWLHQYFTVPSIFIFVSLMSVVAVVVLVFMVPESKVDSKHHTYMRCNINTLWRLLHTPLLLRFTFAMALLTACLSAVFVGLPLWIESTFGQSIVLWHVYGLSLLCSLPPAFLLLGRIEGKIHTANPGYNSNKSLITSLVFASTLIASAVLLLLFWQGTQLRLIVALAVFFGGYSLLSGLLPSSVSRIATKENRGLVLGVYATGQFLGSFFGALLAGVVLGLYGFFGVMFFCLALALAMIIVLIIKVNLGGALRG